VEPISAKVVCIEIKSVFVYFYFHCYGAETLGNKFYMRREPLRSLLVFCTGPFWYTQQLYFQHTLRLYISHGTDTIMTQYDTGRTEIPFGPFDVCIWTSPFLVQDSPIEGTPHQCPSCGIFAESLNYAITTTRCTIINKASIL
jgi:hypothetical protein